MWSALKAQLAACDNTLLLSLEEVLIMLSEIPVYVLNRF
jgi:hypothetical protein